MEEFREILDIDSLHSKHNLVLGDVGTLDANDSNSFKNWLVHEPRRLGKSKAENRYKLMQVFTIENMLTLAEDLVRRCLVVDLVPSSKETEEV